MQLQRFVVLQLFMVILNALMQQNGAFACVMFCISVKFHCCFCTFLSAMGCRALQCFPHLITLHIHHVHIKKVPLMFSPQLLQILMDFHNFLCITLPENATVIGVRISCHTLVMLLLYRAKVLRHKSHTILALCTC